MPVESAMKRVDPSLRGVIQQGNLGVGVKPDTVVAEELSEDEKAEKRFLQVLLKRLVPKFPINKLEKQTLSDIRKYFDEISPILQEELLDRFQKFSP